MWKEGSRKLGVVYAFGVLGFAAFVLTTRTVAELTALLGFFVGIAGWYNQANVREHAIKNGGQK